MQRKFFSSLVRSYHLTPYPFFNQAGPALTYTSTQQWAKEQLVLLREKNPDKCIDLVQFDIGATLAGEYCAGPGDAIDLTFKGAKVPLTKKQISKDMGFPKPIHIGLILQYKEVVEKWIQVYGRPPAIEDQVHLYDVFEKILNKIIDSHVDIIDGAIDTLKFLRSLDIKIAFTTGYTKAQAMRATSKLLEQFQPDSNAMKTAEDGNRYEIVKKNCQELGVKLEKSMFVTDANADVRTVRKGSEHPFIVGVPQFSTHMEAATPRPLKMCTREELDQGAKKVGKMLSENGGAHLIVYSLHDLPLALVAAQRRLNSGELPWQIRHPITIEYPGVKPEESAHLSMRHHP